MCNSDYNDGGSDDDDDNDDGALVISMSAVVVLIYVRYGENKVTNDAIGSAVVVTRMVKSYSSMYVWLCMCVYVCLYSETSLI